MSIRDKIAGVCYPTPRAPDLGRPRVSKPFVWLEADSVKVALSRPTPPDRACRDHQYPEGAYPQGADANASRWAATDRKNTA